MFVIFDKNKNSYVKEINERMVSRDYYVDTTKNDESAFKFNNNNEKYLRHFEKLLKYEPYTLEFERFRYESETDY